MVWSRSPHRHPSPPSRDVGDRHPVGSEGEALVLTPTQVKADAPRLQQSAGHTTWVQRAAKRRCNCVSRQPALSDPSGQEEGPRSMGPTSKQEPCFHLSQQTCSRCLPCPRAVGPPWEGTRTLWSEEVTIEEPVHTHTHVHTHTCTDCAGQAMDRSRADTGGPASPAPPRAAGLWGVGRKDEYEPPEDPRGLSSPWKERLPAPHLPRKGLHKPKRPFTHPRALTSVSPGARPARTRPQIHVTCQQRWTFQPTPEKETLPRLAGIFRPVSVLSGPPRVPRPP